MNQLGDKLQGVWKASGSLEKKYYFMPMTVLAVAIWIFLLLNKVVSIFNKGANLGFLEAIPVYIYELAVVIAMTGIIYVNTRFYPWVAIVLSRLPLFNILFKVDQPFLDSVTEGYRKAKYTVNRRNPKINVQEYRRNPFRGNLERSGSYSNSEERTSELISQLIVNYIIFPVAKFLAVWLVYGISFILGWIAIPYAIRKLV